MDWWWIINNKWLEDARFDTLCAETLAEARHILNNIRQVSTAINKAPYLHHIPNYHIENSVIPDLYSVIGVFAIIFRTVRLVSKRISKAFQNGGLRVCDQPQSGGGVF